MNTTDIVSFVRAKVREVAQLRQAKSDLSDEIDKLQAEIDATEVGKALAKLREAKSNIQARLTIEENETRVLIVKAFNETGDRRPTSKTEVRMFATVTFTDKTRALQWAVENCPDAVTLNEDRLARAVRNLRLGFMEVTDEPRGQIGSDLSEYLE